MLILLLAGIGPALAQDPGTLDPKPLPPLANPDAPTVPAKELFGRKPEPAKMAPRSIGFYAKGCLAGGVALPINGPTWQVMRLSRNRNWGNPHLIAFLERLANKGKKVGWNGLLVGDMSQPRGGPMITGHASHQVGLDADIWLTPMPDRTLSREEREMMSATQMVAEDRLDVDPKVWTHERTLLIRAAAEDPAVERIFVNAAIKKAMCREAGKRHALAAQGAAVVGPRLSLPRPHQLSGRQSRVQAAAADGRGRRLRPRARFLVQGFDAAPQAAADPAEAEAAAHARQPAGRLQAGAERAVRLRSIQLDPAMDDVGSSVAARITSLRLWRPVS